MGISFRGKVASFNARFWCTYWQKRLSFAIVGTSAVRALRIIATDRLRSVSSGTNVPFAPREFFFLIFFNDSSFFVVPFGQVDY